MIIIFILLEITCLDKLHACVYWFYWLYVWINYMHMCIDFIGFMFFSPMGQIDKLTNRYMSPSLSNLGLPLGPSKETRRSPIPAWHGLPKSLPKRTRVLKSRARRSRNPKQAPKLVLEARSTIRGHKSPMINKMMRVFQVLHRSRRRRRSRRRGAPRRTREKLVLWAKRVQQHQGGIKSVQNELFGSAHSADKTVLVGAS